MKSNICTLSKACKPELLTGKRKKKLGCKESKCGQQRPHRSSEERAADLKKHSAQLSRRRLSFPEQSPRPLSSGLHKFSGTLAHARGPGGILEGVSVRRGGGGVRARRSSSSPAPRASKLAGGVQLALKHRRTPHSLGKSCCPEPLSPAALPQSSQTYPGTQQGKDEHPALWNLPERTLMGAQC